MKTLHYLILFLLFLSSCDKFDWHNPYDPECPKELFTPSSPGATMEGNSVKLTWTQENDYISGFALFRSAEGESITNLTQTQKNTTQYLDANFTPGKKYTYYIVAVAGTNKSDTVEAEIVPVIPVSISTGAVTEVAATSAKVSGNISNAGGGTVTSRGICWSTTPGPTVSNSKTTEGIGIGQFVSALTNLLPSTTYYARAYGENSRGISYGSEVSFTTLGPPKLTTTAVTNITATSATSGGTIISDGGSPITETGVCWSTISNPTIANSKTSNGPTKTSFVSNLIGLESSTIYYVRAYASNQFGTSYGEQFSFSTLDLPLFVNGSGVIDIDGNKYKTIIIGGKEWMAENLRVTKFNNGDLIPYVINDAPDKWYFWNTPGYGIYNNNLALDVVFGKFYNGFTIADSRNVCPIGWKVPSSDEWTSLIDLLGGQNLAGGKLKSSDADKWRQPNVGATNLSGFNAFAGGLCFYNGNYINSGDQASFWTSSLFFAGDFEMIGLLATDEKVIRSIPSENKKHGLNIRCIKN